MRTPARLLSLRIVLASVGLLLVLAAWIPGPPFKRTMGTGVLQGTLILAGLGLLTLSRHAGPRTLVGSTLALLTLGLSLLVVEVVVRLVCPIPSSGSAEWASSPGSELLLVSAPDHFRAVHRYNSLGFRGPEVSLSPTKSQRIVCIGDSFTEGIGADENETWPAVLQRQLPADSYEVLNLGDSGSQPDRYLEIFARVAVPLRPTHVMLCVIPSDFVGAYLPAGLTVCETLPDPFHERGSRLRNGLSRAFAGWTYLWDLSQGRWIRRRTMFWSSWDAGYETSALHGLITRGHMSRRKAERMLRERMGQIDPACLDAARRQEFNGARIVAEIITPPAASACRVEDMEIAADDLQECTTAWIRWYGDRCRERGIEPWLIFFPEAGLVHHLPSGPMSDGDLAAFPDRSADNSLSELLGTACRESGVEYVDLTPLLRVAPEPERLFLRYDGHPTKFAYNLAGVQVAKVLLQREKNEPMESESATGGQR